MRLVEKLGRLLRGRPPTPEEVAARAEAAALREQMQSDQLSQRSPAGQVYRSGGR